MAELKNGIIGDLKGKLGKKVFRKMNGKTFASERPAVYKKTKSKKAKSVRGRFAVTVDLAKYVNTIPDLRAVWSNADVKGTSPYHRVIKVNSSCTGNCSPSLNNIITPRGIYLKTKSISLENKNLILQFENIEEAALQNKFSSFSLHALLSFQEPINKRDKKYKLSNISLVGQNISSLSEVTFSLPLDKAALALIKKYKSLILYTAIVFNPPLSKQFFWTSTVSTQLNLNKL